MRFWYINSAISCDLGSIKGDFSPESVISDTSDTLIKRQKSIRAAGRSVVLQVIIRPEWCKPIVYRRRSSCLPKLVPSYDEARNK